MGLIEGRAPNPFLSATVANRTGQKSVDNRNRAFDDAPYRTLVMNYLEHHGRATRKDFDELLLKMLPAVLETAQKASKVSNLLQNMRREGLIHRTGTRSAATWLPGHGRTKRKT